VAGVRTSKIEVAADCTNCPLMSSGHEGAEAGLESAADECCDGERRADAGEGDLGGAAAVDSERQTWTNAC